MTTPIKEKVKHSPLPWTNQGCEYLYDADRRYIGALDSLDRAGQRESGLNIANAELIVRAVNSHAKLVEALEAAEAQLVNCVPTVDTKPNALQLIRKALALAKGEK